MRGFRRSISKVFFALGVLFVAVSIYYFWNAYQIKRQQLERAGDDPFVIVFTDKSQPEDTGRGDDEMTKLNNQRLRSKNRGWLLIISGVGLLIAISALKNWRRKPVALSIEEKR
jgi:hypothetical protein